MALLHLLLFISLLPFALASSSHDCNSTCGNFTISPPFGMNDPHCFHNNKLLEIQCSQHKPYLKFFQLEVIKFDYPSCKVWVNHPIYSSNCKTIGRPFLNMTATPFTYSRQDNVFLGVGCNTQALLLQGSHVYGGCVSICPNHNDSDISGCLGHFCCATSLPPSLSEFNPRIIEPVAANSTGDCNYALIAQDDVRKGWDRRIQNGLKDLNGVPVVLEYHTSCSDSDIADQCGRRNSSGSKSQRLSVIGILLGSQFFSDQSS